MVLKSASCRSVDWKIRGQARRAGRDVKAVHGDVHALLDAGVLEDDSRVVFPYDTVHVDFMLHGAAWGHSKRPARLSVRMAHNKIPGNKIQSKTIDP